ncbi:hypothetical protein GUITHDRAFT_112607 [Guillardia theta CCMP2712]|uniref:Uncharacterized protein n=1 Tax=Guillardia theta (strain CCMP2712) TaxID=905079 RepID=L1IYQ0_GUITC|nr:hypothetical protein GUITHDRAFT_112607 [Guillardia theta CCMP2712]EKX41393.1 hypothetical protein GUITHDRAFT_112607 [Guillardia theta CCMP2712]|eukprot:XP_005828373.1 hypothetical protein GUITHDRAFT_112607 [Guillardia theta CCMP2712]
MSSRGAAFVSLLLVTCFFAGECSNAGDREREAYVTLVTTPNYIIGAEVLAKCLRHVGATRYLVALVGPLLDMNDEQRLKAAGLITRRVEDIQIFEIVELLDRPYFNTTFNKLHVFGLFDEYDKVVFLDADVLVLKNIDELFDVDISTGYPFAAAPEIMPPDRFNTGVLVVAPSKEGLLNEFYPHWFSQDSSHRLPFIYNTLQTVASYYSPAWEMLKEDIKVLHFAGDDLMKPWSFEGSLPPSLGVFLFLWQSIARRVSLWQVRAENLLSRTPAGGDIGLHFKVLNVTDPEEVNALFRNRII